MRLQHDADPDQAIKDSGDDEAPLAARSSPPLDDVPEEGEAGGPNGAKAGARAQAGLPQKRQTTAQQRAALGELYVHEALALMACLVLPLVSAYLLHAIRTQLSRPSEGLVSNYNLTIFLLASELRVFSHMLKLVQSRTLHLQRVAHGNPLAPPSGTGVRVDELVDRVARLETRALAAEAAGGGAALLPLRATVELLLLPLRCVATLTGGGRLASQAEAKPARSRGGRARRIELRSCYDEGLMMCPYV